MSLVIQYDMQPLMILSTFILLLLQCLFSAQFHILTLIVTKFIPFFWREKKTRMRNEFETNEKKHHLNGNKKYRKYNGNVILKWINDLFKCKMGKNSLTKI